MALILSAALLVDRCKWHFWEEEHSYNAKRHQQFYFRLIHIIQRLLHALSDHQLVAGLALLITLNNHACSVTAYHYNLVCTMLILSAVTHLNSLLSIQDYFYKGRVVATYRVIAIAIQCSLSAIVLSGRNTTSGKSSFPSKASSLAIMPAACFLNMNATSYFGFGDALDAAQNATTAVVNSNSTANATAILNDIKSATTSSEGFWEYMLLVAFLLISFFFLIAECFHTHHNPEALKSKPFGWIGISLSGLSIVCSVAVVIIIMNHYNDLRGGMETPQWYQIKAAAQQASSYSEFVTILLVSSASLHGVQAITGTSPNPCLSRGGQRRWLMLRFGRIFAGA
ncbi:hypothetical protein EJ04DRAFT_509484 [Polyplosphaeria fusca]|uniref:Uncharacterized protein n=1 Tax=Polyplosphaeria fusca TaxID=682080 RepID=A0A9P4R803_9PLEO|nr:hypothetical protein EJ04DRAFT_509484 [Polyplosphaeria fusca]